MPHKRSLEKYRLLREAYLTRQAAKLEVFNSAFWDRSSGELICRTDRIEIMKSLTTSAGSAGVEGVDVSQVPDVVHGEVLRDTCGQGTLQKSESGKENRQC